MVGKKGMHKGKQKGKGNNNFKNGSGMSRKIAKTPKTGKCSVCGKPTTAMVVDHVDRNRKNNKRSNLRNVCKSCNQRNSVNKGRFKKGAAQARRAAKASHKPGSARKKTVKVPKRKKSS